MGVVVSGPTKPELRVEVASGGRLRVVQGESVVLLGKREPQARGFRVAAGPDGLRSPLPPIRVADAVRLAEGDPASRSSRWAYRFLEQLDRADSGPLHRGSWLIRPVTLLNAVDHRYDSTRSTTLLDASLWHLTGDSRINWFTSSDNPVISLRRPSPPDARRVKSHRKLVRDGIAPPPLLLFVSGLQASVVIDGHDRISAALAEGGSLECLELAAGLQRDPDLTWLDDDIELLGRLAAHDPPNTDATTAVARRIREHTSQARAQVRTRAWVSDTPTFPWPW